MGLFFWVFSGDPYYIPSAAYLLPNLGMAGYLFVRLRRAKGLPAAFALQDREALLIWLAVFLAAMATGFNPLPIDQESYKGSIIPGRMVASPPDQVLPYVTAVYFFHGKDGHQNNRSYFGEWSVTSRGPLVPLAVDTLLHIFRAKPSDPPNLGRASWPTTKQGAQIARILGWMTNALVVLGVAHLLSTLGVDLRGKRLALAWVALAPVTLINTVFLWPKLLAAYFLLLASAAVLQAAWIAAGLWAALAWLSHPVGALFLPPLFLLLLREAYRQPAARRGHWPEIIRASLYFCAAGAAVVGPWLVYKMVLGYPERFAQYLAGDGRGTIPAASLSSWLDTRADNFWLSLSPGAFFYSDNMKQWAEGPLTEAMRWTVQYAKTLPAGVGFSLCWLAYASFALATEDARRRSLKYLFCGSALVVMLIFWGFSNDGLGRNCLEPLTIMVIALSAADHNKLLPIWPLGIAMLYLEGRWIEISGFVGDPGFSWEAAPIAAWVSWTISSVLGLAIVIWFWRRWLFDNERSVESTGLAAVLLRFRMRKVG
jgi:hypothetical protein